MLYEVITSLREKEFIKSTLERYVSKPLAQQILRQRNELKLGGEEKEVTILFCDIRRFTALAEQLPPAVVVRLLNDYFTRMIEVVVARITSYNVCYTKLLRREPARW